MAKYSGKVLADIIGRLQMMDMKKTMTGAIPYLIVFYLIEKEAWLYRHCTGNTMIQKMMNLVMYFGLAFRNPVPSPFWWDVVVGIIEALAKAYISTQLANTIVFAVLIVVLLVKPAGLLGKYVPEKV